MVIADLVAGRDNPWVEVFDPCHGSRFTHAGDVIEGPATRPLERVPVEGAD